MFPQQPSPPAPPAPDPALAALDEAIEHATIAANAQRDIEAETPPGAPGWQEVADDAEEDDDEEPESPEVAPVASSPAAPAAPEEQPAQTEAPRYSRRDATRFASDLEQRTRERDEARAIVANAQHELERRTAADRHILQQLGEVSGYTRDPQSGRFVYELLAEKVLDGRASADEHQAATEMRQWHELAGPIYREAEQQVQRQYTANWNGLGELEGVDMAQLNSAPDVISAVRAAHAMALKAGEAKAAEAARQKIALLEADNKSMKRNSLASSPQPASTNGAPVPSGNWRDRAFDANGVLTDEFEKEMRSGKLLGVDLHST